MLGIEDIARDLNVSASLVSKVLNNRMGTSRVSQKTQAAILAHAQKVGYRRNLSAAALAQGKHNVIGVFLHRVGVRGSALMEDLMDGISKEAAPHSQRMMVHFYETADRFLAMRSAVHRGVMDGLIVGGLNHAELIDALLTIQREGVPVVTLHDHEISPELCNVGCDQAEVGAMAVRHLLAQGCRRIALMNNSPHRLSGARAALAEAGISCPPELICSDRTYEHGAGASAIAGLLSRGIEFDGYFAHSDQQAAGAINVMVQRGIRVGQQVRVVGVDNSPFCEFAVVPITSVSQRQRDRGRLVVKLLMDAIAHRSVASVCLQPELLVRASSGR